jgi:hypothetical protein
MFTGGEQGIEQVIEAFNCLKQDTRGWVELKV